MMIIYTIEDFLIKKLKNRYLQSAIILFVAGLIYSWHKTDMTSTAWTNYLSLGGTSYYFPMFTIGVLCKKHIELFHKYLDIPLVKTSIFLIAMFGTLIGYIPLLITSIAVVLSAYFIVKDILNNHLEINEFQRLPPLNSSTLFSIIYVFSDRILLKYISYIIFSYLKCHRM